MKLFIWLGVVVLCSLFLNEKMLPLLIGLYLLFACVLLVVPKLRLLFLVIFTGCIGVFFTLLYLIDYIRPFFLYKTRVEGGVGYAQYFGYPIHFDDLYFFVLLSIFLLGTLVFIKLTKRKNE